MVERGTGRGDVAPAAGAAVAGGVALAVLAVGVRAVRERTVVYMPDLWETLLGAQAAGHGQQLVGAWSRLGLYHPGPAWFYWSAPFVALASGRAAGLALAAAALAAGCVLVAHRAARGATDGVAGLVVAAVLAVGVGQLSTIGLAIPWNPTVVILPVAAGTLCVAATVVRGSAWTAGAGAVLGALVAQAHLGTLVLGGALAVGALAAWAVAARRAGEGLPRRPALALLAVAALPWLPLAVDQAVGVGNPATVARYAVTGEVDERFPPEPTGASADVSAVGALRRLGTIMALTERRTAVWAGADLGAGERHRPSPASSTVAVGLLGAAAVAARPRRARRTAGDPLATWVCRLGLAGAAVEAVAVLRVRHEYRPYLVAGAAGVGLALWVGVALAALHAGRARLPAGRAVPLRRVGRVAVPVVVALAALATYDGRIAGYHVDTPSDRATAARVEAAAGDTGVVLLIGARSVLQPALVLTADLDHRGTEVAVRGTYRSHLSDRQRSAPIAGRPALLVRPPRLGLPPGCRDLGSYQGARVCLRPPP